MDDHYSPLVRPEDIPKVFAEAWNRRDPDKIASIFDEDGEFVNVVGLWWHGRKAIRKAHAYGFSRIFNESALSIETVKVKTLSPDIAVVHAKMRLTGQTPVGDVSGPKERTNIFSFVARRTGSGWSCASGHNTDVVPNMETNMVGDDGHFRSVNYRE